MSISIVIVNWNSKDFLRKCLESLGEHCADLRAQIIVVDGASFDGCGELLVTEFPQVEFVQSPENVGFGRSNNLGFERVTGEYVLLLNPDTEVTPGAVQALLSALKDAPDAGLVGARQLNTDGSLQLSSIHRLPTPWNCAFTTAASHRRYWRTSGAEGASVPVPVQAVSGACMLLRSELFQRVGGFTPAYFMYAEDMDLCFKIQRLGLGIYHVPTAAVIHHGGGSSNSQPSRFSVIRKCEALELYHRLNHGKLAALAYRLFLVLSAGLRLPLLLLAGILSSGGTRDRVRGSSTAWAVILRWSLRLDSLLAKSSSLPSKGSAVRSLPCAGSSPQG